MAIFNNIFGGTTAKFLSDAKPIIKKINALEEEYKKLADSDFPVKTAEFKTRHTNGESLDKLLPEAFALVREASRHRSIASS